ncbi:MAG: carboxypeptidase-like regulatory domain-containing protein [Bacteroidota bacterium]
MKGKYCIYMVFFVSLIFQSCRKDIDDLEIINPETSPIARVKSSVHGNVTGSTGEVISGAIVKLGNEMVETDENGVFKFIDQVLNKNGAFITVTKDGYFTGSRRFYPTISATGIVNIELIALDIIGSFNSNSETTINHEGMQFDFPPNAIAREDGTSYSGTVHIAAAYLDPTDEGDLDQMPGDLTGRSVNEELVALKSLGMIAVELLDDAENKLQVKEGQLVDVKIPVPIDLRATAPTSLPMWHFNEEIGLWEEEGAADLVDNAYETSLSHFSFWNCDIPREYAILKGSVLNRGVPFQGIKVVVTDVDDNSSGYAITDENGMFCGFVPGGEELVLTMYNQCGDEIYSMVIGPLEGDVVLDPIILNEILLVAMISGTVSSCEEELSDKVYVKVEYGEQIYTFPVLDDGSILGHITYCNGVRPIEVSAYDPIAGLTTGILNFVLEGDIDVGNLQLCTEDLLIEHVILEYGDVTRDLLNEDNSIFKNYGDGYCNLFFSYYVGQDSGYVNSFYLPVHNTTMISFDSTSSINPTDAGFIGWGKNGFNKYISYNGKEYVQGSGTLENIKIGNE